MVIKRKKKPKEKPEPLYEEEIEEYEEEEEEEYEEEDLPVPKKKVAPSLNEVFQKVDNNLQKLHSRVLELESWAFRIRSS